MSEPEFFVSDANRNRLVKRPKKKRVRGTKQKTGSDLLENLSKLEDAIFEHSSEYRRMFFNKYDSMVDADDFDDCVKKHHFRWIGALKYFWDDLGWRPDPKTKPVRVITVQKNPYLD